MLTRNSRPIVSFSGSDVNGWAGALTPTSFAVCADFTQSVRNVRLVVSVNADMSLPIYRSAYVEPSYATGAEQTYRPVKFQIPSGTLAANTTYFWRIEHQSSPAQLGPIRSVKTAPAAGVAAAFTFAVGSCSEINLNLINNSSGTLSPDVFRSIALDTPLFLAHLGDIAYSNIALTTMRQRDANSRKYRSVPSVAIMNASVPVVYIPDDHDSGPNDCSLDTANAQTIFANTRLEYDESVPHYPYFNPASNALTQIFDIAKVRFIMFDTRLQRRISSLTALGRNLGNGDNWDQLAAISGMFAQAVTDGIEQIVTMMPSTWTGAVNSGFGDIFTAERTAICDIIETCPIPVVHVSGDAHACAFDDGTNTGFSTSGFAFFPQILASGLYQTPLSTSGPYSWNGVDTEKAVQRSQYVIVSYNSANKTWSASIKGDPINPGTFAPTTILSVATTDVTPAVSFVNAAPSVVAGALLTCTLNKTWFGLCSVDWAAPGFTPAAGTVNLLPNTKRTSFTLRAPGAGPVNLTLSAPIGCTISGTNPAVVTIT